jgi:hypothetical protein
MKPENPSLIIFLTFNKEEYYEETDTVFYSSRNGVLHEGDFSMSNAATQNSNPANAWFVFDSKDSVQTL